MQRYYVRVGSLGEIHVSEGDSQLSVGRRVIVRTSRGVELGYVVSALRDRRGSRPTTCRILRETTPQDEWIIQRLERHKRHAVESCRAALLAAGSAATLLDVDQLFDGGTLVMHFLGPTDDLAQGITQQIVAQYESVARVGDFAKLLQEGCGPGCGTGETGGCGTGACGSCGVGCRAQSGNLQGAARS